MDQDLCWLRCLQKGLFVIKLRQIFRRCGAYLEGAVGDAEEVVVDDLVFLGRVLVRPQEEVDVLVYVYLVSGIGRSQITCIYRLKVFASAVYRCS